MDDQSIQDKQTYVTQNQEEKREFPATKEKDGREYELKEVEYKVISQKPLLVDTEVKRTVTYDDLYNKSVKAPDILNVEEKNVKIDLKLTGIDYTDTVITGRKYNLTGSTDYGYRSVQPKAPQEKKVDYLDQVTGQTVSAVLSLKSVQAKDDWTWKEDLKIPMVFNIYDAEYYKIGEKIVPYNDAAPALKGCETELLKVLQLSPEDYKITNFVWDGTPYDVDGVTHRKAIATGSRHVARYVANYGGTIPLPDAPGYDAVANYSGIAKLPADSGAQEYTIVATALYSPVRFDFMKVVVPIMVGLILVVLLVVAILYISTKKKEKKEVENNVGS